MIDKVNDYLKNKDWRIKENSNQSRAYAHMQRYLARHVIAEYCLREIYSFLAEQAHRKAIIHIHDLGDGLQPYCMGWDTYNILVKGFGPGTLNSPTSYPPKHFSSALAQLANFIGTLTLEAAGAQALVNFDTLLAPFIAVDKLNDEQIYQFLQEFVYSINSVTRWSESPFTNIMLDLTVPSNMKELPVVVGGEPYKKFTYGNFEKLQYYMNKLNGMLIRILIKGDAEGRPFTFPVITVNMTRDFKERVSYEIQQLLWAWTEMRGGPYFANFWNSILKPEDVRSMCCHLKLEVKDLPLQRNITGGLFGSSPQTGSLGVVDINLPFLAYDSKNNEKEFWQKVDIYVNLAINTLLVKRKILDKLWNKGLFPFTQYYLKDFDNHFLTISVQGGYEAWEILHPLTNYTSFAIRIMKRVKEILLKWQEKTGYLFNFEAAPGESACYRFARVIPGYEKLYVTQGLNLPVDYSNELDDYLEVYNEILPEFTGGSVFHIYSDEDEILGQKLWFRIKKVLKSKVPYFTITPNMYYCPKCKVTKMGKTTYCPNCGSQVQIYSRVIGYYRPVNLWNEGQQQQFEKRVNIS